ncbi:MAG: 23S rRNA (pseudouridine(1915)-N(3))-methyltransferase RlmH [Dysgonamonadaceae bacterium]|jgi:23S rRNA (pseudouridine1915-N3)-methyltransferase|nr:23S rRNA (pseudouridine(1915)-N(3))-methyltransferase RlmH [Dysgonamonadaceae bacterium]
MKVSLIVIGKTEVSYFAEAIEEYRKRLSHYIPFEIEVVPELKNTKNLNEEQLKEREGACLLKQLQAGDYLILLDDKGKEYTSLQFAAYMEKKMHIVSRRLVFAVGGAYGFSQKVYATAQEKLSLSQMTFSHQMIRLVFTEQLYRAMTILHHEPYHHE